MAYIKLEIFSSTASSQADPITQLLEGRLEIPIRPQYLGFDHMFCLKASFGRGNCNSMAGGDKAMIWEIPGSPDDKRRMAPTVSQPCAEVRVSVAIQAEWRRILNALTVPEYVGAWFAMPGMERLECKPESKSLSFCMEIFVSGAVAVYASCRPSRAGEITYLWENVHMGTSAKSRVKMRLMAGPRRCSLCLTHEGLQNPQERELYSMVWRISLDRLRKVMESRCVRQ